MPMLHAIYTQSFPPKATWGVDDIPDLASRVVVVTGGYAGIGMHTVRALLAHNAKVYVAGRDQAKAANAIAQLRSETGNEAIFLKLDLGNLKSVKAAAAELASKEPAIHMLFNNACVVRLHSRVCVAHVLPAASWRRRWTCLPLMAMTSSGARMCSGEILRPCP
jgi:retinol dehydrogenase-12